MLVEMKWELAELNTHQPKSYRIALASAISPLPVPRQPSDAETTSNTSASVVSSTTAATSASSVSGPSTKAAATLESAIGSKKFCNPPELEPAYEKPTKKQKVTKNKHAVKKEVVLQLGSYGAKMLHCSLASEVWSDTLMWVWWFDQQGTIQSTGMEFIQDLPQFLVFLLAIQRLDVLDWGFDVELDPLVHRRHLPGSSTTAQPGPKTVEPKINNNLKVTFKHNMEELLHNPFCLRGKSTYVFGVNCQDLSLRRIGFHKVNQRP
ncbi:unnamed protein product [Rhizoctonia solani]|uniref:Fungal-type protein kinase domain-containing protein n=1 Tax=Rhizoctonia solani TaxID=456999 RepID=A0A8H2ZZT7_9AGAM|nr:unnamed protein product [Rhizoctonia solani]